MCKVYDLIFLQMQNLARDRKQLLKNKILVHLENCCVKKKLLKIKCNIKASMNSSTITNDNDDGDDDDSGRNIFKVRNIFIYNIFSANYFQQNSTTIFRQKYRNTVMVWRSIYDVKRVVCRIHNCIFPSHEGGKRNQTHHSSWQENDSTRHWWRSDTIIDALKKKKKFFLIF